MGYRIGYNGPEVDRLLQKAYTYSVVNNGWTKLESSDTDPADLNTLTTQGNYSISFWKNAPIQLTTNGPINVSVTKDSATNKIYQTIYDAGKIYIRETTSSSFANTWKEEQNNTELDISSAEPINPVDDYIWIDPSGEVPVIKIYKESTGTWENIAPADMAKQSVYDTKGIKQNINTYLTNKIAEADLETAEKTYESHIVEGEAEGNPIHVTDKEKLKWSNGISTEDAQPYITALETEMTSYADEKINTKATSVNSIESTINEDKTKINAHINDNSIHLTAKQVEEFNGKAAGDHKHLNNGSVTVSASNIVGQIPIARLDPSVLERNYTVSSYEEMLSLTKTEVQNGDSIYVESATLDRITWTEGTMPSSQRWNSVCYGNGKFVAISGGYSSSNVFAYSTDGITWTEGTLPTLPSNQYWNSVCYGNGKFVAISGGYSSSNVFAYSTDGITWTEGTLPSSQRWSPICYGNGKFVVISSGSNVFAYSTDGITWTQGTMPSNQYWSSVCYGNGKFVVISSGSNVFAYSTDGITWTQGTMPSNRYWRSLCYGNGIFMALEYDMQNAGANSYAYSTDGITWTEGTLPNTGVYESCCYGNGIFYAFNGYRSYYSTDIINWFKNSMNSSDIYYAICYGDNKFIAIGYDTNKFVYSTPTFRNVPSAWFVIDDENLNEINGAHKSIIPGDDQQCRWYSVCYGNGIYVATGVNSASAYSYDGINWTVIKNLPVTMEFRRVCYGNGKFIAVENNTGTDGHASYSTDGINWASITMPSVYWEDICYGNGKFVAIENSGKAAYSTDGITWTAGTLPENHTYTNIYYFDGLYALLARDSYFYSFDAITWYEGTLPSSQAFNSLCYNDGTVIATIQEASNIYYYSNDIVNWVEGTLPMTDYWELGCYGNGRFVIIGPRNSVFAYSADAVNWITGALPADDYWSSICYGDGKFVLVSITPSYDPETYDQYENVLYIDESSFTPKGFIQYASPNPELTWDNILNKPTSISDYGVTNVYSKEEIDTLYNEIIESLNKSKEIADEFATNLTTEIPEDLTMTYKNNLLLASELNTKLDETLHSLGYDDEMINDMIEMYKNRNVKLKTTQEEPMIKKNVVIDYVNSDDTDYSLSKDELPSGEVFALDSTDNISGMHMIDEKYYPGYKIDTPDGTGSYIFGGWKRKDIDLPEGETSKEVKVYYMYTNPSSDNLPSAVITGKPSTATYNLNLVDNPSDIHTIDDEHYPEGYSISSDDGTETWTFSGWTKLPKATVDVSVKYEYTIDGDESILPSEVIANKPTDSNYSISIANPTTEVHNVDDTHYPEGYEIDSTDKSGVWTFSGWGGGNSPIIPDFSAMSLGSTFNFGKYQVESETPWAIVWEIVHQTDEYQIAQTKQIIDLRCFDAKESTNTDSNRKRYGNNNWQYSNIKQFLNSDQATWYSAQHSYDAPPSSSNIFGGYNPYDTHKGFLYYFSDEEKSLLKDMTLTLANPTVDGGGSYTWTGKVWLPTYTQMSGKQNNNISEGNKFDKYSNDNSRIKTLHENCAKYNEYCISQKYTSGKAWSYWMSSASPSNSYTTRSVRSGGGPESILNAYYGDGGLAPCICLPRR